MSNIYFSRTQRILCLLCIGICDALKKEVISHDEANQLLFSPWMMEYCKHNKSTNEIVDMIDCGTELDAIKRIVSNEVWHNALEEIKETSLNILSMPCEDFSQLERWVDKLE